MKRVVVIASTPGSVLSQVLEIQSIRDAIELVVSDRECGAIVVARKHGVPTKVFPSACGSEFSDFLFEYFVDTKIDLFVSFYTRIFTGKFLTFFQGKIINFHPAILPGCPGLDGFGDTVRLGCRFVGSTVHYVDEGVDTGPPLIQAVIPYNPSESFRENRHKVFIQHCRMLIQIISWLHQDRLRGVEVVGALYDVSEYSPNLDAVEAIDWVP